MADVPASWTTPHNALGLAIEVKRDPVTPPTEVSASWVIPSEALGLVIEVGSDTGLPPRHASWTTPSDAIGIEIEVAKEGSPPPGPETGADWTTSSTAVGLAIEVQAGPGGPAGFVTADWTTLSDALGVGFEVKVEDSQAGATWATASDALGLGFELKAAPPPPPPEPPVGSPAPTPEQMRNGLARNLSSIPGVQIAPYPLANPTLPYLEIVSGPIEYDKAMGRGLDFITYTVRAFVAYQSDIGAQKRLDQFLQSAGEFSVKEALESDTTLGLGGKVDDVVVLSCTGQQPYTRESGGQLIGAEWTVQIYASGI